MTGGVGGGIASWQHTSNFYLSLQRIMATGIDISHAVGMAAGSIPGYSRWAPQWQQQLASGAPLYQCLQDSNERQLICSLIQAGEDSGHLSEICGDIANFYQHAVQMKRMVIGRLIYPTLLIHAALILPSLAPVIMGNAAWWNLLLGPALLWLTIALVFIFLHLKQTAGLRAKLSRKAPIVRKIIHDWVSAHCALVLGACLKAGMLYDQALELTARSCGHQGYARDLAACSAQLRQSPDIGLAGALDAAGLHGHTLQVIAQGEASGSLERSLQQVQVIAREAFHSRLQWTVRIGCGIILAAAMLYAALTIVSMYMNTVILPLQEAGEW